MTSSGSSKDGGISDGTSSLWDTGVLSSSMTLEVKVMWSSL